MISLNCRGCPYGREDYKRRLEAFENNPIFAQLDYDDIAKQSEKSIWCDKVGGKTYYCGHCGDVANNHSKNILPNRIKNPCIGMQKKRMRSAKNKKHLEELYRWSSLYRAGGAYKCYRYNLYGEVVFYKKDYRSYGRRCYHNYIKKYANKKVRHFKGEINNGSAYKKVSGLQWIIRE